MFISIKQTLCILLFLFTAPFAVAQKIAVINIDKAAIESDYAQGEIKNLLESDGYKKQVEAYKGLRAEVEALQKEGKANELTWSEDQNKEQLNKIRSRVNQLQTLGGEIENAKSVVNRRLLKELTPKLKKIINDMILEKKLDLLLNAQAAHYVAPGSDLTKELTERLNKLESAKQ